MTFDCRTEGEAATGAIIEAGPHVGWRSGYTLGQWPFRGGECTLYSGRSDVRVEEKSEP